MPMLARRILKGAIETSKLGLAHWSTQISVQRRLGPSPEPLLPIHPHQHMVRPLFRIVRQPRGGRSWDHYLYSMNWLCNVG